MHSLPVSSGEQMVHSVVGNDVNIQLRREINQSVGQRCLVEPGAGRKSAAASTIFVTPDKWENSEI